MLFSIVIPTFNRARLLARTLESVWGQCFTDYEVVVVDDGSTDDTAEIARAYGFRVVVTRNCGLRRARNIGLQTAARLYGRLARHQIFAKVGYLFRF